MSKIEKLIGRLKQKPNDFTFAEIERILLHFGYTKHAGSGSHFVFKKKDSNTITIPTHGNRVKKAYIEQIIDIIGLEDDNEK